MADMMYAQMDGKYFSQLVIESDFIVIGRLQTNSSEKYTDKALLHINEHVKNKIESQIVIRDVNGFLEDSSYIIVFIQKYKNCENDSITYQYYDFDYDIKSLHAHRERIIELLEICKRDNYNKSRITEWLVECAEDSLTRWDGINEIAPLYTPIFYRKISSLDSKYPSGFIKSEPEYLIDEKQKRRLQNILYNSHSIGLIELKFVDTFIEDKDQKLLDFLKDKLISEKYSTNSDAFKIMDRILFITQDDKLKKILLERNNIKDDAYKIIKEEELIDNFIKQL